MKSSPRCSFKKFELLLKARNTANLSFLFFIFLQQQLQLNKAVQSGCVSHYFLVPGHPDILELNNQDNGDDVESDILSRASDQTHNDPATVWEWSRFIPPCFAHVAFSFSSPPSLWHPALIHRWRTTSGKIRYFLRLSTVHVLPRVAKVIKKNWDFLVEVWFSRNEFLAQLNLIILIRSI